MSSSSHGDRAPPSSGVSDMARRMRDFDWSATPLGPREDWPQSLKTAVGIMLKARYPMFIWWGRELINLYNDGYVPMLGIRHPGALGESAAVIWGEIWDTIGPQTDAVLNQGQATWNEEQLLVLERNGYPEEAYFTFSYSPVPGDDGGIGGLFCALTEDTQRVLGERRLKALQELSARTSEEATSAEQACETATRVLAGHRRDVSFALIYLLDDGANVARLASAMGLPEASPAAPARIDLAASDGESAGWPLRTVLASGRAEIVTDLARRFGALPGGVWPEPTHTAVVLPVAKSGQERLAGFLVTGVSPRRKLDDNYRVFLDLLTSHVKNAITQARAYDEERTRAEALSELDREKTAFFSNVSHDLRTPLTLMLAKVRREALLREEALRAELDNILDGMTDGFLVLDHDWRITYVNATAEKVNGVTKESLLGKIHWDAFPAVRGTDFERELRRAMEERVAVRRESFYEPYGRWFEMDIHPIKDGGLAFYGRDITERKRAEEALRASEQNLAAELSAMTRLQEVSTRLVQTGDSTSLLQEIVDAAIAITAADMGAIQLFDRDSGTLRIVASRGFERPFLEFFDTVHDGQAACGHAMLTGCRTVIEDVVTSPVFADTPSLRVVLDAGVRAVQSTRLVSRSGRLVGMLSTHYRAPHRLADWDLGILDLLGRQAADWIERQHAEAEREALLESERGARTAAERATRLKDDFLATLSHELRTPLNAIMGWTQLVKIGIRDPEKALRGVEIIERNAQAQTRLIADLLDLSRIVTGKLRLDVQPVDLPLLVNAAVEAVRPAAHGRGIDIQAVIEPITQLFHGDAARLQQILWNLLSNAVKFTPEGGRVRMVLARADSHAEITVSDTGRGIRPEFLPHVFERFRQADASATREHGGLGIGLAVVKQLTELHGGEVRVASDGEGMGATFVLKLPLSTLPARDEDPPQHPRVPARMSMLTDENPPELNGVKVLVVDDEPDSQEVIKRILEDRGAVVVTACSVDEAIAALEGAAFDILLSDIGMPKRDGYEFISEVRKRGMKTPAAAITAFARSEDRTKALRSGYQAHVTKPVEASELLATVAALSGRIGLRSDRGKTNLS